MKISVIQVGARHHYAIPRMLQAEGIFDELMTDFCGFPGVIEGRGSRFWPKSLKRLMERIPVGIPRDRIRTTWKTTFLEFIALRGYTHDHWDLDGAMYRCFEAACFHQGLLGADIIYGMLFESSPAFLRAARERGQKLILDVYITPIWHQIVSVEREAFPQWEGSDPILRSAFEIRFAEQAEIVDILLCPSWSVARDVQELVPEHSHKIRIVPYGCGANFAGRSNCPKKGRILFSGTVGLRKGGHYLAEAASILRSRGKNYDFVIAGGASSNIRGLPECKELKFLGRLPRARMLDEFLMADIMVFPSLAEGCAGSVHEALLCGLPVITTASAGSILRHGVGGNLTRERDSHALADAIEEVVEDRLLRNQLAIATAEYAELLDEASWQRNLRSVFDSIY